MSAGDAGERSKIQRPVNLGWSVKNRPGRGGQQGEGGHHGEGDRTRPAEEWASCRAVREGESGQAQHNAAPLTTAFGIKR